MPTLSKHYYNDSKGVTYVRKAEAFLRKFENGAGERERGQESGTLQRKSFTSNFVFSRYFTTFFLRIFGVNPGCSNVLRAFEAYNGNIEWELASSLVFFSYIHYFSFSPPLPFLVIPLFALGFVRRAFCWNNIIIVRGEEGRRGEGSFYGYNVHARLSFVAFTTPSRV